MSLNTKENGYILGLLNNVELYPNEKIENINTSNLKLNRIVTASNYFVNNLKNNSAQTLNILNKYSNQNYVDTIDLTSLSGYFKSLGKEVNFLQETIIQMITNNQQNELTLDNQNEVLFENSDILKQNSNEELAAFKNKSIVIVVEEVANNIFNNTQKIIKMAHLAETVINVAISEKALVRERIAVISEIEDEINSIIQAITIIHKIASRTHDAVVDIDIILKLIVSNTDKRELNAENDLKGNSKEILC